MVYGAAACNITAHNSAAWKFPHKQLIKWATFE